MHDWRWQSDSGGCTDANRSWAQGHCRCRRNDLQQQLQLWLTGWEAGPEQRLQPHSLQRASATFTFHTHVCSRIHCHCKGHGRCGCGCGWLPQ